MPQQNDIDALRHALHILLLATVDRDLAEGRELTEEEWAARDIALRVLAKTNREETD